MMKNPYKKISSKKVYSNPWFSVRKDHLIKDNNEIEYHTVEKDDAVFIIPILYTYKVVFVKLFRHPINKWSLELPAGSTDGEDPWKAANRELQEETGYICSSLQKLAMFNIAPGITNNRAHVFIARGLEKTKFNKQKEEGILGTVEIHLDDIDKYIMEGKIDDSPTITCLSYLSLLYKTYETQWSYIRDNDNVSEKKDKENGHLKDETSHSKGDG